MEFTAKQIAELINGTIEGNPEEKIHDLSKIEEGRPGTLSFLANPKYTQYIYSSRSSVIIVNHDFEPENAVSATLIRVDDAYSAFATLLDHYNQLTKTRTGIAESAFIASSARTGKDVYVGPLAHVGENSVIGDGARIHPQVYIGDNVIIGEKTEIHPGVCIYSGMKIGKHCTIHGGAVIGSDGFGFAPQDDKHYKKVAQIGNVIIEDNVEIGAGTTIDRATLGSTIIRKGVKLDNLIQVAHNVEIGENTVIAAQSGISGSTKIGRNCLIAGQVGITGHLRIGDGSMIGAQSGISSNLPDGSVVLGSPAFDIKKYRKSYVYFRNLPDIVLRLEKLEKKLKDQG